MDGRVWWRLVFFLIDDYGFADVGYHVDMYGRDPSPAWNSTAGANRMATPNLDRLSAQGVRLENYYIQVHAHSCLSTTCLLHRLRLLIWLYNCRLALWWLCVTSRACSG